MGLSIDLTPAQHNHTKVGWVNEPNGRGTLSILVSCLSSLFLSSWAVMHLNVPCRRSSTARRLATYLYWCIFGIFGPELVIWTAWRQLLSAWALRKELRKVRIDISCTDRAVADFFEGHRQQLDTCTWFLYSYGWLRYRSRYSLQIARSSFHQWHRTASSYSKRLASSR